MKKRVDATVFVGHFRNEIVKCTDRAARALKDAYAALRGGNDVDDVLSNILDAQMALGEARGIANAVYDLTDGQVGQVGQKRRRR
jgi:hypothetical protein